jgi:hypothetical protein
LSAPPWPTDPNLLFNKIQGDVYEW